MTPVEFQRLMITLSVVGVLACAMLAAYGFKGRVTTIGVDLGTTFSVVGVRMGKDVFIIEDEDKHTLFPSVVSYLDNGDIIVGRSAVAMLESHPQNTIFNSKRFIGRNWNEDIVQQYGQAHPYTIAEIDTTISNYSTVGFELKLFQAEDTNTYTTKHISPESVGTNILKYLLQKTAAYLGHDQVNKAVIAVPAKFNAQQRLATGAAYKAAGLKVVRVIEEPTAAAVAYDLHKNSNIHHILVYDFGGGTLDVSLLYVAQGAVYATDGDEDLGGSDLDMCLYHYISNKIATEYHMDWHTLEQQQHTIEHQHHTTTSPSSPSHASSHQMDKQICLPATVRQKAEQVKKQLSYNTHTTFTCQLNTQSMEPVEFTISTEDFHRECKGLFDRSLIPVRRLLDDLNMSPENIDEVVLVGGTTRIPLIKTLLKEFFNKVSLNDRIDPDITVAYGAASIID